MTATEAIAILRRHNRWRRGAEIKPETPIRLGLAIEKVCAALERHEKKLPKREINC
jgi:hypothetical protein